MEELKRRNYSGRRQNYARSGYTAGKIQPKTDYRETILSQCIVSGIILIIALGASLVDTGLTNGIRSGMRAALSGETNFDSITNGIDSLTQSYAGAKNSLNTIFGRMPDSEELQGVNYASTAGEQEAGVFDAAENDNSGSTNNTSNGASDNINENHEVFNQLKDSQGINTAETNNHSPTDQQALNQETFSQASSNLIAEPAIMLDEDFRIDEDILAQLNAKVDFYNTNNKP